MFPPQISTPDQLSAILQQVIHTQQVLVSLLSACLIPQQAFAAPTELYQNVSTSWSPTSWPQTEAQQHGCCPQPEMPATEAWTSLPQNGHFVPHPVYKDPHVACLITTWLQTFDRPVQLSPDTLRVISTFVSVPADRVLEDFQTTWPWRAGYQHDASALPSERDPRTKKAADSEPVIESRTSFVSNPEPTTRSQEVQTTLTIAQNFDEHEIFIQHQPGSLQTETTSRIKSCLQFHEGAWTIVHQPPKARPHQTSKQKVHTIFCRRDSAHVIMARFVARISSKKFLQDRGLTLKPWKRTICNTITNGRNLHPVYAHRTQLRSMILIQSEDKAPDTVANEEALDFGLILAKHMSLLPQEMLEE